MRNGERFMAEFAEFYTANFAGARRIAYALCGNWTEAEEIAQASFVKMFTHWAKVRREGEQAYLRTVLTTTFLDTKRRWRAKEHTVSEVDDRPVDAGFAGVDERDHLCLALCRVSPRQRAVLVLRFLQDQSTEQVAATLGCSVGTVKSQTARGLDTLRRTYRELAAEPVRAEMGS